MPSKQFPQLAPGTMPTAEWFNSIADGVESANDLSSATPGLAQSVGAGGPVLQDSRPGAFLARLTTSAGTANSNGKFPYGWIREVSTTGGMNQDAGEGVQGTQTIGPAFEANNSNSVQSGTLVWMWPSDDASEMRFVSAVLKVIDTCGNSFSPLTLHVIGALAGSPLTYTPYISATDYQTTPNTYLAGGITFNNTLLLQQSNPAGLCRPNLTLQPAYAGRGAVVRNCTFGATSVSSITNSLGQNDASGIMPGMLVTGSGIPANTYVTSCAAGSASLSQNVPAGSGQVTFTQGNFDYSGIIEGGPTGVPLQFLGSGTKAVSSLIVGRDPLFPDTNNQTFPGVLLTGGSFGMAFDTRAIAALVVGTPNSDGSASDVGGGFIATGVKLNSETNGYQGGTFISVAPGIQANTEMYLFSLANDEGGNSFRPAAFFGGQSIGGIVMSAPGFFPASSGGGCVLTGPQEINIVGGFFSVTPAGQPFASRKSGATQNVTISGTTLEITGGIITKVS